VSASAGFSDDLLDDGSMLSIEQLEGDIAVLEPALRDIAKWPAAGRAQERAKSALALLDRRRRSPVEEPE
jgi:hypothetical protein